jgi:hypothetical protein
VRHCQLGRVSSNNMVDPTRVTVRQRDDNKDLSRINLPYHLQSFTKKPEWTAGDSSQDSGITMERRRSSKEMKSDAVMFPRIIAQLDIGLSLRYS